MKLMTASLLGLIVLTASLRAAEMTLVKDGQAQTVIVVATDVMAADKKVAKADALATEQETNRRRLRESVNDLALYLGKISGAKIEIVAGEPAASKERLPIFVGALAEKKFGPVKAKAGFRQGFRFVVSPQGVGLFGESDLATSYAIYEMLDRFGCRWYMPSELGEVIPRKKTLALPEWDEALARLPLRSAHSGGCWVRCEGRFIQGSSFLIHGYTSPPGISRVFARGRLAHCCAPSNAAWRVTRQTSRDASSSMIPTTCTSNICCARGTHNSEL